jgi:hypothetical protein
MAYEKKKDVLKRELARRLSTRLKRRVLISEILDRREAAKLAGLSENHFTNGFSDNFPNYFLADASRFAPHGLMLFLRSDVERRASWQGRPLDWPSEAEEPNAQDLINLMGGWQPGDP